ncbi:electron transport complex protein RnfA [Desulfovibrio psychrotolerans]|uniref:Ion-translocating oxidoreductase complex subunit A n=1 Tax=Desulfovibrio psychrotolerans TaxID=415242 RepID=A0A7J0BRG3_9BACT|nr:RnfABCDGE type electron transport complex subunit A [Desulfovibrio psychrotolerans]GFM36307.1 electron transport complex subunit A [Desulfovibrio psychrotolerans]
MLEYFLLLISAVFVNNVVLAQYLGQCPYLGCSKEKGVSIGMGGAVIFVMLIATPITWLIQSLVLIPLDLGYLQTIMFILVIASLVQLVEMFLKKAIPPLYSSLGIFLPLITTNCAVLGVAILVQRNSYDLGTSVYYSFATGLGFMLALVLLASIRERMEISRLPLSMKGVPAGLVIAGIMSMSFMAFAGMI